MSVEPLNLAEIDGLRAAIPTGDRANDAPWPLIASLVATIDRAEGSAAAHLAETTVHCRQHGVETVAQLAGLVHVYREERDEMEDHIDILGAELVAPAPLDIDSIEARATAATPGPWVERDNSDEGRGVSSACPRYRGDDVVCLGSDGLSADLEFIAAAREDIPALVAEIRRLRANEAQRLTDRAHLVAAIRAITVDAPDDQPNGPAERALVDLEKALCGFPWRDPAVDDALDAAARLCEALADDTKALREAAERFFGGDFSKPW